MNIISFFNVCWSSLAKHLELQLLCRMNFDNESISITDIWLKRFSVSLELVMINFVFQKICLSSQLWSVSLLLFQYL
jgi:hypothetical protein